MLPTTDFCDLTITRLIIGANPFGGFSHQNKTRDEEMRSYYTIDRIIETWDRAEQAGINTMITNNESEHVVEAVRRYLSSGGSLQWIAQVNCRKKPNMHEAIDEAVQIGCSALYFHGALVDKAYSEGDDSTIHDWCDYARSKGVPAGVAGHAPEAHLWVDGLDAADFHAVCFFNWGSLHDGRGSKFKLGDISPAVQCIKKINKPCIGYKIMGAGRIEPRMAFEYAFEMIKPGDVVNVGIHRGDNDNMVEENVIMVDEVLSSSAELRSA